MIATLREYINFLYCTPPKKWVSMHTYLLHKEENARWVAVARAYRRKTSGDPRAMCLFVNAADNTWRRTVKDRYNRTINDYLKQNIAK